MLPSTVKNENACSVDRAECLAIVLHTITRATHKSYQLPTTCTFYQQSQKRPCVHLLQLRRWKSLTQQGPRSGGREDPACIRQSVSVRVWQAQRSGFMTSRQGVGARGQSMLVCQRRCGRWDGLVQPRNQGFIGKPIAGIPSS